jgi:hypothetical protein
MDYLKLTKKAVNFVVGAGATKIVHNFISNNTLAEQALPARAAMAVSSVVLGMMVREATEEFTDRQIDKVAEWWNTEIKPKLNK